jgi:hypothetical protein
MAAGASYRTGIREHDAIIGPSAKHEPMIRDLHR